MLLGLLVACGAPPAAPTTPDAPMASQAPAATSAAVTAPSSSADAPKADAPKADAPKADAPKADAPKALPASKHTINGVSISQVTEKDVQAVLEKAGWKVEPGGIQPAAKYGKNEIFSVVAYKGPKADKSAKQLFYFGFARQTATSDPKNAESEANFEPRKLKEMYLGSNPKLIYLFDEEAGVLVTVTRVKGVTEDELKKIFEQTVVKAKLGPRSPPGPPCNRDLPSCSLWRSWWPARRRPRPLHRLLRRCRWPCPSRMRRPRRRWPTRLRRRHRRQLRRRRRRRRAPRRACRRSTRRWSVPARRARRG